MIKRKILNHQDALHVLRYADPVQMEEWRSVVDFPTPEYQAKEIMNHSVLKWSLHLDGIPIAIFGATRETHTTLKIWCLTVKNPPKKVWVVMLREMLSIGRYIFKGNLARRFQALCCTNRFAPVYFASKGGMNPLTEIENYGVGKDFKLMEITPRELS